MFCVSDNDNLELKKRSRRRLVGAAALALIAAIVLPMVMDGEPTPPVSDIQVTIPDRTVDASPIGSRDAIVEPVTEAPAELAAPAVIEPAPAPTVQAAPSVPAPKPEPAAPAPKPEPTSPKPESAPKTPAAPKAEPAPAAEEESAEARRARAILEGRAAPEESVQFLVQIGAFSDETKARTRQMDLAAKGFTSFVESSGGVSRVRMGPFASRVEAESMIARLRGASFDGVVTTR